MSINDCKRPEPEYLQRVRDPVYNPLQAADKADVRKAAFTTDGRPLIPAVLIAMTNGDFAAVDDVRLRSEFVYGTTKPIIVTPQT